MNDPFSKNTDNRETIPAAKKKDGFAATQEPHEYFNQGLFEAVTDHVWGTSAQVASDDATFYTDASGNPLDKTASAVTINEDDKILIAHNVAATANMALICGGKKVRLEMLKGVNWNLSTFNLTLGTTGDSFSGDIELTGTGTLTIEESNSFKVHHSAMTIVNSAGNIIINNNPNLIGTFSPSLKFGGASVGMIYSVQAGNYLKIGSWVFIDVAILLTSKGSSTGNATIEGLPFALTGNTVANTITPTQLNFTETPFVTMLSGTTLKIEEPVSGNVPIALTNASFVAPGVPGFWFNMKYRAA